MKKPEEKYFMHFGLILYDVIFGEHISIIGLNTRKTHQIDRKQNIGGNERVCKQR